jgi:hypothetical protein
MVVSDEDADIGCGGKTSVLSKNGIKFLGFGFSLGCILVDDNKSMVLLMFNSDLHEYSFA